MADSSVHRHLHLTTPPQEGHDVRELQEAINALAHHYEFPLWAVKVDGELGPNTLRGARRAAWLIGLSTRRLQVIAGGKLPHVSKTVQALIRNPQKRSGEDRAREAARAPERRKRRKEMNEGPRAVVAWLEKQIGITEQPYGSNWGPHIEDWIRYTGYTGPVFWCGCLTCYAVVEIGGAKIPARSRLGFDGYINADAAAGQNGLRRVSLDDARAGDIVTWDFHHISTCVGPVSGGCIPTIDGNTSSDDAGSQSNGGGVFAKNRSVSSVVTVARPAY